MTDDGIQQPLRALEFFAGIGGFSAAVKSNRSIEVEHAFEISPHCVEVYRNTWDSPISQVNLLSERVEIPPADLWWISAPCTPFTRRGAQKDLADHRADPFVVMMERISTHAPEWILMENVEGFVDSDAHALWRETTTDYQVWEEVVCPTDLGVPNKRPRFYTIACKRPFTPPQKERVENSLMRTLFAMEPGESIAPRILEKYGRVMHMCDVQSEYTTCFTGGYAKSWVYAGSFDGRDADEPRLFSPQQVAHVMGLEEIVWPSSIGTRQRYKYLGNSLSVWVVSKLLESVQKRQPTEALNPSLVGTTETRG